MRTTKSPGRDFCDAFYHSLRSELHVRHPELKVIRGGANDISIALIESDLCGDSLDPPVIMWLSLWRAEISMHLAHWTQMTMGQAAEDLPKYVKPHTCVCEYADPLFFDQIYSTIDEVLAGIKCALSIRACGAESCNA